MTAVEISFRRGSSARIYATRRQRLKQCCIFVVPFYALFLFIVVSSAIYFFVENGCHSTFQCGQPDFAFEDNTGKDVMQFLSSAQISELRGNYSDVIETLDYWKSIHFIVITISTIGYGDIVPCSNGGRVVAIISAIVGIPVMVVALSKFGEIFGILLHKLWRLIYLRIFKPPYSEHRERQLANPEYVPLTIGICITLLWVMTCGFYFYMTLVHSYHWPKTFSFVNALYFTMVSFLTIGYGEFAPIRYELIFPNMVMLMIGLSLVALCIRLFKANVEDLIDDFVDKIDKDFTETIPDDDEEDVISNNDKKLNVVDSEQAVKKLMDEKQQRSGAMTKVLVASMANSQQKKLAQIYEEKSKFVNTHTQTVVENVDFEMQVSIVVPSVRRIASAVSFSHVSCQVELDQDSEFYEDEDDEDFEFAPTNSRRTKTKHKNHVKRYFHPKRLRRHL